MASDDIAEYSHEKLTDEHLRQLAEISHHEVETFFRRNPHLHAYQDAYLLSALTQGGALHYASGGRHRVKDLDIHSSFVRIDPEKTQLRRQRQVIDFGTSVFGRHPEDARLGLKGRHVDSIFRLVDTAQLGDDPVEAVRRYLEDSSTPTAFHLRQKAVIALDPPELFGTVVWHNRAADLNPHYDS